MPPDDPAVRESARPRRENGGCASASASARDCSRSSTGTIGSASARTGSTRYRLASITLPPPGSPPTGSHPVRDANSSNASDSTMDGTASRRIDSALAIRATSDCRLRRDDPERDADDRGEQQRRAAKDRAPSRALGYQGGHTALRVHARLAEIQPDDVAGPDGVLLIQRAVEAQPGALGGDRLGTGLERRQPAARREPREDHRRGRDQQDEHEGRHDPPNQKRQDPRPHVRLQHTGRTAAIIGSAARRPRRGCRRSTGVAESAAPASG